MFSIRKVLLSIKQSAIKHPTQLSKGCEASLDPVRIFSFGKGVVFVALEIFLLSFLKSNKKVKW